MVKQIDPRVIRTRKLIMDALIELSMKKEFKDITIKDITNIATVNRSTFYSHFIDKYDLLEKVLKESITRDVIEEVNSHQEINADTIESIFQSIIKLKKRIGKRCYRSYDEYSKKIEEILKKELQELFLRYGKKQWSNHNQKEVESFSVMLSWALYGAVNHCIENELSELNSYVKQIMNVIDVYNLNFS